MSANALRVITPLVLARHLLVGRRREPPPAVAGAAWTRRRCAPLPVRPGLRGRRPRGPRRSGETSGETPARARPAGRRYDGVRALSAPADAGRAARGGLKPRPPDRLRRSTTCRSASRRATSGAGVGAAARRRREPDRLRIREAGAPVGRRGRAGGSSGTARACAVDAARLAAGYLPILEHGVHRRPGHPLRAGVVRDANPADALARQLREGDRPYPGIGAVPAVRDRAAALREPAARPAGSVPRLRRGREVRRGLGALQGPAEAVAHGLRGVARSRPSLTRPFKLDRAFYEHARGGRRPGTGTGSWRRRRSSRSPTGGSMNAERNLLIQNLLHAWRYSLANAYERFSWEMIDVAEVLGEYGHAGVEREIVKESFHRRSLFPNRAAGVRMAGVGRLFRRTGDMRFVSRMTPALRILTRQAAGAARPQPERAARPRALRRGHVRPVYGLHDAGARLAGAARNRGRLAGAPGTRCSRPRRPRRPTGSRPPLAQRWPRRRPGSGTARCSSRCRCSTRRSSRTARSPTP